MKLKQIACLLAILLGVSAAADDEFQPVLDVDVTGNAPILRLDGIPLTAAVECYFANASWWGKYNIPFTGERKLVRDDNGGCLTLTGTRADFQYEYRMSWSGRKAAFLFRYRLKPGGGYVHGVLDLFMDKGQFPVKPEYKIGQETLGAPRKDVVLSNEFGDFAFTFKTSDPETAVWKVRNTAVQKFRPAEFQTISIINCASSPQKEVEVELTVEYRPTRTGLRNLQAATLKKMLRIYAESAAGAEEREWIRMQESRLRQLLAAPYFEPAQWAELRTAISDHAGAFSAAAGSFAGTGVIVPSPQQQQFGGEIFTLAETLIETDGSPEAGRCAELLAADLNTYFGLKARTAESGGNLVLGIAPDAVKGKSEAYVLTVSKDRIAITGTDVRGLFYGIQSLQQLIVKNRDGALTVRCGRINDWPDLEFRGFMIELGSHAEGAAKTYDLIRRMIPRIIGRYKFNAAVIGESGSGVIRWDSHPETAWPHAIDTAQLRQLVADSRNAYLEPIPVIESLGHVRSILNAHPELAEFKGKERVDAFCMSDPGVKKILADIYDECIDIFHPDYFHIGCDEAVYMGTCPKCSSRPLDEIFTEHVKWCYDYLKKKKIKNIIMWHDMLMDKKDFPNYPCNMNEKSVAKAIESLPRDIIIDFWEYGKTDLKPGIEYFRKHGYRVLGSSWYDDENCFAMGKTLADNKALGILETSWTYTWEFDQMSLASIENAWSVEKPPLKALRYDPLKIAQAAMLPPQPSNFSGTKATPLALDKIANSTFGSLLPTVGCIGTLLLPPGPGFYGDVAYRIPDSGKVVAVAGSRAKQVSGLPSAIRIPVNDTAVGLAFFQSCLPADVFKTYPVAEYRVVYEDGGETTIPVVNYRNVGALKTGAVGMDAKYRERGLGAVPDAKHIPVLTSFAEKLNFHCFEWVNPHPEKKISEIRLEMTKPGDRDILLLAGLALIRLVHCKS